MSLTATSAELTLIIVELVISYLPPVDFMHVIEACKYLYEKYQNKTQEKRKESLITFVKYDTVRDLYHKGISRGTKLPNGDMEGKVEILTKWHYGIYNYANSKQVGHRSIYQHLRHGKRYISEKSKKLIRDNLVRKFRRWEDIDTSKMDLISRTDIDINTKDASFATRSTDE